MFKKKLPVRHFGSAICNRMETALQELKNIRIPSVWQHTHDTVSTEASTTEEQYHPSQDMVFWQPNSLDKCKQLESKHHGKVKSNISFLDSSEIYICKTIYIFVVTVPLMVGLPSCLQACCHGNQLSSNGTHLIGNLHSHTVGMLQQCRLLISKQFMQHMNTR